MVKSLLAELWCAASAHGQAQLRTAAYHPIWSASGTVVASDDDKAEVAISILA